MTRGEKGGSGWLTVEQPRLGLAGLLVLLAISNLTMPLSMDMYTPAVPHMVGYFGTNEGVVNLTLALYMLFYSVGLLVFGPVSDRFGRRHLLVAGMVIFAAANACCACSESIEMLIAARSAAAVGAGAVSAISPAIVKDAFAAERCETILSIIQVMLVTGPVLAPVIGAFVLQAFDWRMIFWVLAGIGAACSVLALLFRETLPESARGTLSVGRQFLQLLVVAKDKGFSVFMCIAAMFNLPFMAFISVASYVYIVQFGLSDMGYGLFFALNALFTVIGPALCVTAGRVVSARWFMTGLIVAGGVSGAMLLAVGHLSPVAFFAGFAVFSIVEAALRPFSMNILLLQNEDNAGAASSLANFSYMAVGCVGMAIAVLPWPNFIVGLGIVTVGSMIVAAVAWIALLASRAPLKSVTDEAIARPE